MPSVSIDRQFSGTMRLIEVQLRRAAENYDVEENIKIVLDKGMINEDDAEFIKSTFKLNERIKAGLSLDPDEGAQIIKRIHKLVSNNLNMGDCA